MDICPLKEVNNAMHLFEVYMELRAMNSTGSMDYDGVRVQTSQRPDPEPWWMLDLADYEIFLRRFFQSCEPWERTVFHDHVLLGTYDRPSLLDELHQSYKETERKRRLEAQMTVSEYSGDTYTPEPFLSRDILSEDRVCKNFRDTYPHMAHLEDDDIIKIATDVLARLDRAIDSLQGAYKKD